VVRVEQYDQGRRRVEPRTRNEIRAGLSALPADCVSSSVCLPNTQTSDRIQVGNMSNMDTDDSPAVSSAAATSALSLAL
jgi:hypothetical protein